MKIPQTTTPLTKFIRTTEGWLVVGANVLLVVVGAAGDMSLTKSATAVAVLNGVTAVSRSVLKAIVGASPIVGQPEIPVGFKDPGAKA